MDENEHICEHNTDLGTMVESRIIYDFIEKSWHISAECNAAQVFDITYCPFCGVKLDD